MELCVPTAETPNRMGITTKEFPKTKALFLLTQALIVICQKRMK